ncbi:hypothetical protein [Telmatospirillum sp.]|uniref:hypothetical protein n=1 Tax=Telmatospirillum sp. TaxID=2079197 RepID=UPI00284BEA78|nr:hypothetical protein [Telmatospirillum sp.]MDR3436435.1 hypothetical protein [Telmatospirillum sp.]
MADDTLSIEIDGAPVDLFMSYGLLTELSRSVPGLDSVPALDLDNDVRDDFISVLIAERTKSGKTIGKRLLADVDISIADIERLLDWGKDHLLGFFLRRAEKAQAHGKQISAVLGQSSSAGTPA